MWLQPMQYVIVNVDREKNLNKLDQTRPPMIHSFVMCALYSQNTNIFWGKYFYVDIDIGWRCCYGDLGLCNQSNQGLFNQIAVHPP